MYELLITPAHETIAYSIMCTISFLVVVAVVANLWKYSLLVKVLMVITVRWHGRCCVSAMIREIIYFCYKSFEKSAPMQTWCKKAQEFSHKYNHSGALNHTATILFVGQYHHTHDNFHYCVHGQWPNIHCY